MIDAAYIASTAAPFANSAFNTQGGTIFQSTGAAQNVVGLSQTNLSQGQVVCTNYQNPTVLQNALMLKDTKVPNIIVSRGQVSIQMM